MTTKVNEHFNASTREFHQNTSVNTLQYAISFLSIAEEMLRRVCKQSFVFCTSPSSYYEVTDKFISFDTLPKIPYLPFKHLSTEDLELIIDYKKHGYKHVKSQLFVAMQQRTNFRPCQCLFTNVMLVTTRR